ncbi:signal peptidase I [Verrucomicrobium spinosum]|uniref:signal peptidase I n=1 Tax=Verrucomicrobium spinosum TaxID=2736 RepID=UPI0001744916|nr:signal peptidase I [Verrucomicrobium spinosum]
MFQPRFIKHAKLLRKGVTRFLHYKRDLLPTAKVDEIIGLRGELDAAISQRNSTRIDELSKQLNQVCERALPDARTTEWAENIEVFFVSIVIALGIRSYIAQPFQIPTGSMQPTLNGIRAEATEKDPNPGFLGKLGGFFTGTTYLNVVSDHEGPLRLSDTITEHKFLIFRPYSRLHFADGHDIRISCPKIQLERELNIGAHLRTEMMEGNSDTPDRRATMQMANASSIYVRKGQVLARGIVQNGDHVIVNKFAYHFRRPTRGEVFVFTTKNIAGIEGRNFDERWGSQHYIKRLGGVPEDTVSIKDSQLFINGQLATEPGFKRVMTGTYTEPKDGYRGYEDAIQDFTGRRVPVREIALQKKQYLALGDNSYQSSDSRYWGPVPEQNVVGPGWFCYWPLTSHWGVIR